MSSRWEAATRPHTSPRHGEGQPRLHEQGADAGPASSSTIVSRINSPTTPTTMNSAAVIRPWSAASDSRPGGPSSPEPMSLPHRGLPAAPGGAKRSKQRPARPRGSRAPRHTAAASNGMPARKLRRRRRASASATATTTATATAATTSRQQQRHSFHSAQQRPRRHSSTTASASAGSVPDVIPAWHRFKSKPLSSDSNTLVIDTSKRAADGSPMTPPSPPQGTLKDAVIAQLQTCLQEAADQLVRRELEVEAAEHRAASLRHQLDAVRARLHATTGSVAGTKGLLPSDPFYARAQARAVQAATEEVERAAASSPVRSASSASQRRAHRSLVPPPTASSPRLPGGSQRSLSPLTWQGDSEKVSRAAETMRRLRTQVAALTQQRDEAQREARELRDQRAREAVLAATAAATPRRRRGKGSSSGKATPTRGRPRQAREVAHPLLATLAELHVDMWSPQQRRQVAKLLERHTTSQQAESAAEVAASLEPARAAYGAAIKLEDAHAVAWSSRMARLSTVLSSMRGIMRTSLSSHDVRHLRVPAAMVVAMAHAQPQHQRHKQQPQQPQQPQQQVEGAAPLTAKQTVGVKALLTQLRTCRKLIKDGNAEMDRLRSSVKYYQHAAIDKLDTIQRQLLQRTRTLLDARPGTAEVALQRRPAVVHRCTGNNALIGTFCISGIDMRVYLDIHDPGVEGAALALVLPPASVSKGGGSGGSEEEEAADEDDEERDSSWQQLHWRWPPLRLTARDPVTQLELQCTVTRDQLLLAADAAPWIQVQPFYDTVAGAEQGSEPNIKQAEALLQRSASNKAAAHTFETARMTAASFVASLLAIRHGSAPSAEHTASTTVPADSFAEELDLMKQEVAAAATRTAHEAVFGASVQLVMMTERVDQTATMASASLRSQAPAAEAAPPPQPATTVGSPPPQSSNSPPTLALRPSTSRQRGEFPSLGQEGAGDDAGFGATRKLGAGTPRWADASSGNSDSLRAEADTWINHDDMGQQAGMDSDAPEPRQLELYARPSTPELTMEDNEEEEEYVTRTGADAITSGQSWFSAASSSSSMDTEELSSSLTQSQPRPQAHAHSLLASSDTWSVGESEPSSGSPDAEVAVALSRHATVHGNSSSSSGGAGAKVGSPSVTPRGIGELHRLTDAQAERLQHLALPPHDAATAAHALRGPLLAASFTTTMAASQCQLPLLLLQHMSPQHAQGSSGDRGRHVETAWGVESTRSTSGDVSVAEVGSLAFKALHLCVVAVAEAETLLIDGRQAASSVPAVLVRVEREATTTAAAAAAYDDLGTDGALPAVLLAPAQVEHIVKRCCGAAGLAVLQRGFGSPAAVTPRGPSPSMGTPSLHHQYDLLRFLASRVRALQMPGSNTGAMSLDSPAFAFSSPSAPTQLAVARSHVELVFATTPHVTVMERGAQALGGREPSMVWVELMRSVGSLPDCTTPLPASLAASSSSLCGLSQLPGVNLTVQELLPAPMGMGMGMGMGVAGVVFVGKVGGAKQRGFMRLGRVATVRMPDLRLPQSTASGAGGGAGAGAGGSSGHSPVHHANGLAMLTWRASVSSEEWGVALRSGLAWVDATTAMTSPRASSRSPGTTSDDEVDSADGRVALVVRRAAFDALLLQASS